MPVERCVVDARPGFRWGARGKCYTYDPNDDAARQRARRKAEEQGRAIKARGDDGRS